MLKIFRIIILSLFIVILNGQMCSAAPYKNFNDLIENGRNLDNKIITVQGEVIGDRMKRGNYSWINISDGSNGMGIWIKNEDADAIKVYGNYNNKGDTVEIEGKFNRACKEHGGDMDIHAQSIKIIKAGYPVNHAINRNKIITALLLTAVTIILAILSKMKRG